MSLKSNSGYKFRIKFNNTNTKINYYSQKTIMFMKNVQIIYDNLTIYNFDE